MKPFEELTEAEKAIRNKKQFLQERRLKNRKTFEDYYYDEETGRVKARHKPITEPLDSHSDFNVDHTYYTEIHSDNMIINVLGFLAFIFLLFKIVSKILS